MNKGDLYLCVRAAQVGVFQFKPGDILLVVKHVKSRSLNDVIIFTKGTIFKPYPQYTLICSASIFDVEIEPLVLISTLTEYKDSCLIPPETYHHDQNDVIIHLGEDLARNLGPHMDFIAERALHGTQEQSPIYG